MPDDLRRSWCNDNRNKVHNKCDTLESSWNHPHSLPPPTLVHGKIVFHETSPWYPNIWDHWSRSFLLKLWSGTSSVRTSGSFLEMQLPGHLLRPTESELGFWRNRLAIYPQAEVWEANNGSLTPALFPDYFKSHWMLAEIDKQDKIS